MKTKNKTKFHCLARGAKVSGHTHIPERVCELRKRVEEAQGMVLIRKCLDADDLEALVEATDGIVEIIPQGCQWGGSRFGRGGSG